VEASERAELEHDYETGWSEVSSSEVFFEESRLRVKGTTIGGQLLLRPRLWGEHVR
jgi:hypothetical protein